MKLSGLIAEVGTARTGMSQQTGKAWTCRALSLLVPYYTERGEAKYDNIVADYFGDTPDTELMAAVESRQPMNFTLAFTTRTYNGRRYQEVRVFNLSAKM